MDNTMLVVDDVEMNREILKLIFRNNYMILEAETGKETLEILESCQGHVDIVLLDLTMPDMGGFEVLEKRRQLDYFKDVPVVVITASEHMNDQIRAFELGASDFINKPFVPEIVLSRVNNVMNSYKRMLRIELEAKDLRVKSELDQMTGLYNKTTAEYMIDNILFEHPEQEHALLVIDIDNFKSVNDMSGHLAGDHTIRIVADLISSLFRKTDIVGRIGGDEYAVMMVNVNGMEIVRSKVNELIQIMKYKPNLTIPENVSLSVGFVGSDRKVTDYRGMFKKADAALYLAKEAGKARYQEYGMEPVNFEDDRRKAVLLVSRNRSVCSVVHALMPPQLRIMEALQISDLAHITLEEQKKIVLSYVDVSDTLDDGAAIWETLMPYEWLKNTVVLAICQESNIAQYRLAMMAAADDILSAPLESVSFKRRTMKQLENAGVVTNE